VLASSETMTTLIHAGGTELLQKSRSTKKDTYCKVVMWLLQPIMLS